MRVMGTFQSRDAADAVKDAFIAEGYNAEDMIVMANRANPEPPEDADVEPGEQGEGGFAAIEEKVGKIALGLMGKKNTLDGDGTEGEGRDGALLTITVATQPQADRVKAVLERHFASDIEQLDQ